VKNNRREEAFNEFITIALLANSASTRKLDALKVPLEKLPGDSWMDGVIWLMSGFSR
jgi:hypothetical protein